MTGKSWYLVLRVERRWQGGWGLRERRSVWEFALVPVGVQIQNPSGCCLVYAEAVVKSTCHGKRHGVVSRHTIQVIMARVNNAHSG